MTDYTPEAIAKDVELLRSAHGDGLGMFKVEWDALERLLSLAERVAKAIVTMPFWQNAPDRTWVEVTVPDDWFNQRVYLVNLKQSP